MNILTASSRNRTFWPTTFVAAFCLLLAASAYAAGRGPCAEDAARLCKGVQQGQGRIAACLREHRDELSPACREKIATAKKELKEAADACRDDSQKLCKDIQPGQGRIARCLKQHEAELSPGCKEHLARPQGRRS